jgi:hypothetical protein
MTLWSNYYILVGHEPKRLDDVDAWGRWYESADRHVALTEFEDGLFISTVFLGTDHNFFSKGPPLLFETMIGKINRETSCSTFEEHQWRYATWNEAEAGHKAALRMVLMRMEYSK